MRRRITVGNSPHYISHLGADRSPLAHKALQAHESDPFISSSFLVAGQSVVLLGQGIFFKCWLRIFHISNRSSVVMGAAPEVEGITQTSVEQGSGHPCPVTPSALPLHGRVLARAPLVSEQVL